MITTGQPYSSATKTEIVDVVNGETCSHLADFPVEIWGAVGANLHGKPVVCGGSYSSTYYQKCYIFTSSVWQEFATMKKNRWRAAGVMFQNKFHIFGGLDLHNVGSLQSSEILSIGGEVVYGPDLPTGIWRHAITAINESVSILSGGWTDYNLYSDQTWYFNHETQTFSPGPNLLVGRRGHSSATNVDKVTKAKIPVVSGGAIRGFNVTIDYVDSTELLINGQWQPGTNQCKKKQSVLFSLVLSICLT